MRDARRLWAARKRCTGQSEGRKKTAWMISPCEVDQLISRMNGPLVMNLLKLIEAGECWISHRQTFIIRGTNNSPDQCVYPSKRRPRRVNAT